jgi:hypothetical protein
MRKVMVILALLTLLVSTLLVSCGENKEQKSEKAKNSEDKVSGSYFNEDDFNEYIKLKADGTVFWRENIYSELIEKQKHDTKPGLVKPMTGEYGEYIEAAGKWKIDGKEIAFIGPLGDVERGRIKGDILHVDGKVWIKHGGASKTSNKKISKSKIAGKYKAIYVEREGSNTHKEDLGVMILKKNGEVLHGESAKSAMPSGTWRIENGLMQIYEPDKKKSKFSKGRIEGSSIIFEKLGIGGRLLTFKLLKQD